MAALYTDFKQGKFTSPMELPPDEAAALANQIIAAAEATLPLHRLTAESASVEQWEEERRLADDPAWIITTKSPYLASLVGFGLLEQCAMLRTNAWDWDGMPTHTIDNPRLLGRTGKRRRYGMTDQIVDLRHKLILLEESLGVTRIQFIDTARRLSAWRTLQPTDPRQDLYDALFEARNLMMHGVRTEGWEGWLVTLLCFIVYADQLMSG